MFYFFARKRKMFILLANFSLKSLDNRKNTSTFASLFHGRADIIDGDYSSVG
jgi:hypothetical protein